MKKYLIFYFLLSLTILTNPVSAQILQDKSGNRFITIGSSKDEVLEILGTPSKVVASLNLWYYGYEHLSFDGNDRLRDYTDAKRLKVLLLPSKKQIDIKNFSPSTIRSPDKSPYVPNVKTASASLGLPASSPCVSPVKGYGEISEKTSRPKTVYVSGHYRKDGTYVKPHYRSSPRKK